MQSGKVTEDTAVATPAMSKQSAHGEETAHRKYRRSCDCFWSFGSCWILVGSVIEIYPMLSLNKFVDPVKTNNLILTLELAGTWCLSKKGCYVCHSAANSSNGRRGFTLWTSFNDWRFDVWSSIPMGIKRTGPDLSREGNGMMFGTIAIWWILSIHDSSITIPSYEWLAKRDTDFLSLRKKFRSWKCWMFLMIKETLANTIWWQKKKPSTLRTDYELKTICSCWYRTQGNHCFDRYLGIRSKKEVRWNNKLCLILQIFIDNFGMFLFGCICRCSFVELSPWG